MPFVPTPSRQFYPQDQRPNFVCTSPPTTVAAAGSAQGDAAALTDTNNTVTGGNGSLGVRLNATVPVGGTTIVENRAAGALLVYPPTGGNIGAGSTNASNSLAANTTAIYLRQSATQFVRIG